MESFKYKGTPEQMARVAEWALENGAEWGVGSPDDFGALSKCANFGVVLTESGTIFYIDFYSTADEPVLELTPALELEIFGKTEGITGKVENEWVMNNGLRPLGTNDQKVDYKMANEAWDRCHHTDLGGGLRWGIAGIGTDITHWRLHKSDDEYFQEPKTEKSLEDAYDSPYSKEYHDLVKVATSTPPVERRAEPRNKYSREIKPGVFCDVYDVLRAFNVTDPCLQHAAKKMLACGVRGHKDATEDYADILASVTRAVELNKEWSV